MERSKDTNHTHDCYLNHELLLISHTNGVYFRTAKLCYIALPLFQMRTIINRSFTLDELYLYSSHRLRIRSGSQIRRNSYALFKFQTTLFRVSEGDKRSEFENDSFQSLFFDAREMKSYSLDLTRRCTSLCISVLWGLPKTTVAAEMTGHRLVLYVLDGFAGWLLVVRYLCMHYHGQRIHNTTKKYIFTRSPGGGYWTSLQVTSQSLCFAYWSISDNDTYIDISSRAWNYFTSIVGLGFGLVLAGRMVITLDWVGEFGWGKSWRWVQETWIRTESSWEASLIHLKWRLTYLTEA